MPDRSLAGEWQAALAGLALAVIGWWVGSVLLAMAGAVVAVTAAGLRIWQQQSLTGVRYSRTLGQHRATFGEEVALDIRILNDKVIPLTWLHVDDQVPGQITIRGGRVTTERYGRDGHLHHVLPLLPYQRVTRHMTVVCDRRGLHHFGPAEVTSGNPMGYKMERATVTRRQELLVYPKIFRLTPTGPASRLPLGDHRSDQRILGDPSRITGVRPYEPGDPLRHIDWRATARSDSLLVRVFEPTTSLRVAVFADLWVPQTKFTYREAPESEFAVAVAASVVSDLAERRVAVGLFSSSTVQGAEIAHVPSQGAESLPIMLELLARSVEPISARFAPMLLSRGSRLQAGTSLVVLAAHFSTATVEAMADLHRRLPITTVWIRGEAGSPPPPELSDARWEVSFTDDWQARSDLELGS
jgi:uncharacterized protein (DUF58 family)